MSSNGIDTMSREKIMIDRVKVKICEVKDFPKPGIGFKDITPVVQDPEAYQYVIKRLTAWAREKKPQLIAGIESRGFLFAAPVAHNLGLGMVVIRKRGKLPRKTVCVQAPNEYAVEHFELHADSIRPEERVVVIDDLIATGSSSVSALNLVHLLGGKAVGFAALVELSFLHGVETIRKAHPEVDVFALVKFEA
jgi:adenine phosphoribosyltransferase